MPRLSSSAMPRGATPADLPHSLEPQLATLVDAPRPGDWLYEIKLDGYRMLARIGGPRDVRLVTRRDNDWTARFPALKAELIAAKLPPGWYDGEIVMLDSKGMPSFGELQNAIEGGKNEQIVFYLFDVPFMGRFDLRRVPVEERRALLAGALKETDRLILSKEIEGDVRNISATACKLGLEGVIGKRRGSFYVHRRSEDWIKLKCVQRQEFVIGGYTWPDESRNDAGLGALLVGQRDSRGVLQYSGKVGTGFTGRVSASLRRRLDAIAQPERPFAGTTGHDGHAQWVRPELVCEVAYNEWPAGGSLRHASFKGLREDKPAASVTQEVIAHDKRKPATPKITNASRVIDASTGLTKGDLVRYYVEVAPWLLPHVAGRPVYVARFPEGLAGIRIFQQHPQGLKGLRGTDPALWPGHDPAIAIDSVDDLVALAQMDAIEIHGWNSTASAILQPDRLVLDIDPGEGLAWAAIVEGALLVKTTLDELGLRSWVKTTGGKALHVVVPLKPELDYPAVRAFSQAIVLHLSQTFPDRFVATSGARNRVGRIFIDYLRNGQSQSTAEAFSARARPGMGVSMPIGWEALDAIQSGAHWNIANAVAHLRKRRKDPWANFWKSRQSLAAAIDRLRTHA